MGRRRPTSGWARRTQRAVAWLAIVLARGVARLPSGAIDRLGPALGEVGYWLLIGRRRVTLGNLASAFGPTLDATSRRRLARAHFRHLGVTLLECVRIFFGPPGALLDRMRIDGPEHLKDALAVGRGVLFLTGHLGNWELLAAAHGQIGVPTNVIVRPLDNPFLDMALAHARERTGLRLIPKRRAVSDVLAALARGECVGILLDQNAGPRGVFVPFFDRLASTSRSLAVLALRTGSPVVPAFLHRLPSGEHQVTLKPAIPLVRTGAYERDIELNTARYAAAIEQQVRAHPEQWFWVHRRWKTRPT